MKTTVRQPQTKRTMVQDLQPGTLFLADGTPSRDWSRRAVFMMLYQHTRFADLKKYQSTKRDLVCVNTGTGRLVSFDCGYPVIELKSDGIELEAKANGSWPNEIDAMPYFKQAGTGARYIGTEQVVTYEELESIAIEMETEAINPYLKALWRTFIRKLSKRRDQ